MITDLSGALTKTVKKYFKEATKILSFSRLSRINAVCKSPRLYLKTRSLYN